MSDITTLRDDMAFLTEWEDRYAYIIDLGRALDVLPEAERTAELKVSGCTSQVWLSHREESGKHYFQVASDAIIVQGLLAILMALYNGKTSAEIQAGNAAELLAEIGLSSHLSPNRRSGFAAVTDKIKSYAA